MRYTGFFLFVSILLSGCSLEPHAWNPPQKPALVGPMAPNELLQTIEYIDLKGWYGPEDIASDELGNLYAGAHQGENDFDEGVIVKIDPSGNVSIYADTGSWVAGLHFDKQGQLIACDQKRGLVSVAPDGHITVLADKDEHGRPILIPNDVDVASDGMIYFSNSSTKSRFNIDVARKLILEAKPDGGLHRYDPQTGKVETLIDGSYFANGVAVSENDEFVLLVELSRYRILRYWLKGEKQGKTDVFIDNLPGFPNGVSRREDGSFWLGFTTRRNDSVDKVHPSPLLKKIVYALPMWMQPKQERFGIVIHLSKDGEIIKTYYDTTGEFVSEASSIEERNGHLYLGGDITGHIGKYRLPD